MLSDHELPQKCGNYGDPLTIVNIENYFQRDKKKCTLYKGRLLIYQSNHNKVSTDLTI